MSSMFIDKIGKARFEISKTNDRLQKLKSHKKHMQMQVNILKLKDKSSSSQAISPTSEGDNSLAHDAVLYLKLHSVTGLTDPSIQAHKCYI